MKNDEIESKRPALTVRARRREAQKARAVMLLRAAAAAAGVFAFALWAHFGSGLQVFSAHGTTEPGWEKFRARYKGDSFGDDGYFTRAVQNGYNIVHHTPKYAWRFSRKAASDYPNACIHCHSTESLAYAFVRSDRFDPVLQRRISFEDRVMRCYVQRLDGFVPTIYDPAVRDIRIYARLVAHSLQLSEGSVESAQ